MVRAALESIAFQVYEAVELMQSESGTALYELRVDGGASENGRLMQFQANLLNRKVVKPDVAELSAMGSVYMGGLGIGFWTSMDEIEILSGTGRRYTPEMESVIRARHVSGWKSAVARVLKGT